MINVAVHVPKMNLNTNVQKCLEGTHGERWVRGGAFKNINKFKYFRQKWFISMQ